MHSTGDTGRPAHDWHFDQDVLQAEAAVDGWYALLTTLTPEQADAADVLRRHKSQDTVEHRYGDYKGPWPSPLSSCRTTSAIGSLPPR